MTDMEEEAAIETAQAIIELNRTETEEWAAIEKEMREAVIQEKKATLNYTLENKQKGLWGSRNDH